MHVQEFPSNPSIENLRKQAKTLRNAVRANDRDAVARVREFHGTLKDSSKEFQLNDAQLVVARSYGFPSWTKLKLYVEVVERHTFTPSEGDAESRADQFVRLACLDYQSDRVERHERARELFADHPSLAAENIFTATTLGDFATVTRMLDEEPTLA